MASERAFGRGLEHGGERRCPGQQRACIGNFFRLRLVLTACDRRREENKLAEGHRLSGWRGNHLARITNRLVLTGARMVQIEMTCCSRSLEKIGNKRE